MKSENEVSNSDDSEDPPPALFTPSNLKYLEGIDDVTGSAKRMREKRLHERTQLFVSRDAHYLDEGVDARRIADEIKPKEVAGAIESVTAFLYEVADQLGVDAEHCFEEGIKAGQSNRVQSLLTDVISRPETLTNADFERLYNHGYLSDDQYHRLVDHRPDESPSGEEVQRAVMEPVGEHDNKVDDDVPEADHALDLLQSPDETVDST